MTPQTPYEVSPEQIGSNIRLVRKQRKLTGASVAALVGVSTQRQSIIEQGKNPHNMATLNALARVLEIPVRDFLDPELHTHIEFREPGAP